MANESKTQLKSYFQLGDKPNQAQFENLIDSMVDADQAGYPIFSTSKSYVVDDVVAYDGKFYRFISDHAAGAWNGADVELTSINEEAQRKVTELESEVGFTKDVNVVSAEIDFRFFKGEKYSVTNNNDTSKTVSIVSARGASDRNNLMDLNAYNTKEFIAEIDATCFRCAQNGNFTIKKFAIKSDVETLKENVETLKEDASMLYSDVADTKNDSFNQDKGEWKLRRTHLHPIESDVILEYLGKTECVITISGAPNNFNLIGTNKATGNHMHLLNVTSDMAMPLVINNPRPDLELINLRMSGLSTTDREQMYDVEITKSNPFIKIDENFAEIELSLNTTNEKISDLSDDAFILDNEGLAKVSKDIVVKPSKTVVVLEYLGKRECTFVLNGTPNNGVIVGTNKATGNQMHLFYVTTDTAFPLVVDNPRPDLELINVGFLGRSTATATPLNFTIEKQSYIHSDLDNIHNSIFNYDKSEDVVFEKSIVVKAGKSVNILDYLGKVDCEFTIEGTPNNFIFQTTVEETGTTVELGRYTTEDALPITFANPRYYQELTNLRIYGFTSALETELSITIRKKNAILSNLKNTPLVRFDFGHELKDMSGIVAMFNPSELNDTQQWRTMPNQLYDAFDGLVNQYPSYVSRVDIATELGLTYPSYASLNGVATSKYAATPTYKTYMYKLVCSEDSANGSEKTTKLKVLIVAGVHGNEIFAPMNAFHFAKALCESSDENYFKMRGAFDFYIIPCLNTYGMYHFGQNIIHDARCNANDVNLNRNFPVKNWAVSGEGTMDYTGASAGSEFETQLVMKALQSIQPNLYIDHHNYGAESQMQYFCTVNHRDYLRLNYQSYMDCNIAFVKGLPEYFGTSFKQVKASLVNTSPSTSGTTNRWCYENKMADFSATLEICNVIKYKNGEILAKNIGEDLYGADALSVGEYTLRNIIMRFCQYVMEVLSNKNGYQLKS